MAHANPAVASISTSVNGDQEDVTPAERPTTGRARSLCAVQGPMPTDDACAPPPVRLRREFKGLTVADLQLEDVARRLPGQVWSALEHLERGDYAAAERALPGQLATIIEGPGHGRTSQSRRGLLLALVVASLAAAVVYFLLS